MAPRSVDCERRSAKAPGSEKRAKPAQQQTDFSGVVQQLNGTRMEPLKPNTQVPWPQTLSPRPTIEDQKAARLSQYQERHQKFLAEAEQRRMKRADLETRKKVWQESKDKTQARIKTIEVEHKSLLQKLNTMEAAQKHYNTANQVCVSVEQDKEMGKKWQAFLDLETDELDV